MSDNIVTQLRANDCFEFPSCDDVKQQAADEIERLRNQIRQLEAERDQWIRQAIGHG